MEIKNVEFSYGNHKVLNDISFKVQEGKITTIIGANGCGKSTLFNVITKNLKPQKGSVLLNGEDINIFLSKTLQDRLPLYISIIQHLMTLQLKNW